ncbi:MAG TPA: tetratricopeptide repeat protein [Pyrinomonadaceae bacterium]
MSKGFLYLLSSAFFTAVIFLQIGCASSGAANNSVDGNANAATANVVAQAATPTPAETPLPEFTDAQAALAEGVKLIDENSTEKAIEALRQAVKLNSDLGEAHFQLGIAYSLLEKEKEKMTETEEPTPTPTPVKKGKTVEPARTDAEKSFENAVKAYEKYIKKNPKDDLAHFNLGLAYNKLNDDLKAEKVLREAVKLKPDDTEYQTQLGEILIKLAQYEEAVRALKKALEIDSSNLQAEDLLEKAQAGKKRVDFGIKPKLPEQKNAPEPPARVAQKQKAPPKRIVAATPETKNANQ